jgi:hypothetical protein
MLLIDVRVIDDDVLFLRERFFQPAKENAENNFGLRLLAFIAMDFVSNLVGIEPDISAIDQTLRKRRLAGPGHPH